MPQNYNLGEVVTSRQLIDTLLSNVYTNLVLLNIIIFSLTAKLALMYDTTPILRLIESGVRSAIPWSRHLNLEHQLQHINQNLQRSMMVETKLKNIDRQFKRKTLEKQRSISKSLAISQKRRDNYLSQRKKQMSLHSKKVKDKLMGYYTTQKKQFKKASADQKIFSDTISQYWIKKAKQNQVRERKIYNKYRKSEQHRRHSESQFLLTQISDEEVKISKRPMKYKYRNRQQDKGHQVRTRMQEQDQAKHQQSFQKIMRKLSKIERNKKLSNMRPSKTENLDDQSNISYNYGASYHDQDVKDDAILENNAFPLTSLIYQRKKLPSHYLQNLKKRKKIEQSIYNSHTKYLQNYKHRIRYLTNVKQVKEKLTQTKIIVERQQKRSQSLL